MRLNVYLFLILATCNALLIPSVKELRSENELTVSENTIGGAPRLGGSQCTDTVSTPDQNRTDTLKRDSSPPHSYIVILKDGYNNEEYGAHGEWVTEQVSTMRKRGLLDDDLQTFQISSLKGYSGYMPSVLVDIMRNNTMVDFIEPDFEVYASEVDIQDDAPWGLARVSQRQQSKSAHHKYVHENDGGKGVTAFVLDSGIKPDHPDFEGRARWTDVLGLAHEDETGHGTHVAGTIGGKTFGIAKKVSLVAIKVFDSKASGHVSGIIKALDFVVRDHQAKVAANEKGYKGATVNLSLGGHASEALDLAVNAATAAGVHVIVAAGNENMDACSMSPAGASGPITVGAIDNHDHKATFSNWGKCVDIQAPGDHIQSLGVQWKSRTRSGTSMAAPHVTGLISYLLSLQPEPESEFSSRQLISPAEMKRRFLSFGTHDVISGLGHSTPNILAYNGADGDIAEFWNT